MTKGSQQPAERHQTHSKNATTHPGSIVLEMLGVRRQPEEIENEKRAKNTQRQARKDKGACEQTTVSEIAEFEC